MKLYSVVVLAASLLAIPSAFADILVGSEAVQFEVRENVEVLKTEYRTLQFKKASGEIIRLECGGNVDEYLNNTFLDWPGLAEGMEQRAPLIIHGIVGKVGTLKRQDFYCDTLLGKHDAPEFQVAKAITQAQGKKIELKARLNFAIVETDKQFIQTVSLLQLDFVDLTSGKSLATYSARPGHRDLKIVYPMTSTGLFPKKP